MSDFPMSLDCDPRPALRGWAPGSYIFRCFHCLKPVIGDKRASECAPCAYRLDEECKRALADDRLIAAMCGC